MAAFASVLSQAAPLTPGAGRFEVQHDGRTLPVWYYLPEKARPDAPVLVVMYGVNRDADRYRNDWLPHARKDGFILVVPEFSEVAFPGTEGYSLEAKGAFSFIEPVFDAVREATGNRSARYHLYGHSAGAQFVHRFLYFVPQARVAKAVAANAGWWTLPDPAVGFPYGLKGSSVDEARLKAALQRPLVVLLGTEDTDPNHANLRRTPEALAQGPHRFARGHTFFDAGKKHAAALGVPLGWQLATAPGVAHSDAGMSAFAVRWLFGPPSNAGRDPIPLWPGRPPQFLAGAPAEFVERHGVVRNVTVPSIVVFAAPVEKRTGMAVIVCAGGGYGGLAWQTHVEFAAEVFNPLGVAVIGLKYRLRPPHLLNNAGIQALTLLDAKRAVRVVRYRAAEWGIDPRKIGIAGYSAGANLAMNLAANFDSGDPNASDPIERESSRPDFAVGCATWHWREKESPFVFRRDAPPVFLVHATNDGVPNAEGLIGGAPIELPRAIEADLKKLGVPVRLAVFDEGGHGVGNLIPQRVRNGFPPARWPWLLIEWLGTLPR